MKSEIKDLKKSLCRNPQILYRVISIFISSIFFSYVPVIVFLVYMGHHGFFSYDFFSDGVFGLKAFFMLSSLFILMITFVLFGSLLCFAKPVVMFLQNRDVDSENKELNFSETLTNKLLDWIQLPRKGSIVNKEKESQQQAPEKQRWFKQNWGYVLWGAFNALMILYFILLSPLDNIRFLFYFFFISVPILLHIAFFIHGSAQGQLMSLVFLIVSVLLVTTGWRAESVKVVSSILKDYGIGGGVNAVVEFEKKGQPTVQKGKLLLTTPANIYIKFEGSEDISTIQRNKLDVITVSGKPKNNL